MVAAMREIGPVRLLLGNSREEVEAAKPYIGIARTQLGLAKNLMKLGGLSSYAMARRLEDGTVIIVQSVMGQDTIRIVPVVPAPQVRKVVPSADMAPTTPAVETELEVSTFVVGGFWRDAGGNDMPCYWTVKTRGRSSTRVRTDLPHLGYGGSVGAMSADGTRFVGSVYLDNVDYFTKVCWWENGVLTLGVQGGLLDADAYGNNMAIRYEGALTPSGNSLPRKYTATGGGLTRQPYPNPTLDIYLTDDYLGNYEYPPPEPPGTFRDSFHQRAALNMIDQGDEYAFLHMREDAPPATAPGTNTGLTDEDTMDTVPEWDDDWGTYIGSKELDPELDGGYAETFTAEVRIVDVVGFPSQVELDVQLNAPGVLHTLSKSIEPRNIDLSCISPDGGTLGGSVPIILANWAPNDGQRPAVWVNGTLTVLPFTGTIRAVTDNSVYVLADQGAFPTTTIARVGPAGTTNIATAQFANGVAITNDGRIAHGYTITTGPTNYHPLRWTEGVGTEYLDLPGGLGALLAGASADGSCATGWSHVAGDSALRRATLWDGLKAYEFDVASSFVSFGQCIRRVP